MLRCVSVVKSTRPTLQTLLTITKPFAATLLVSAQKTLVSCVFFGANLQNPNNNQLLLVVTLLYAVVGRNLFGNESSEICEYGDLDCGNLLKRLHLCWVDCFFLYGLGCAAFNMFVWCVFGVYSIRQRVSRYADSFSGT